MRDLEHPSITQANRTGYPEKEEICTVCANPHCEWPIYKGDRVLKLGRDLYCNGQCLADSMNRGKDE